MKLNELTTPFNTIQMVTYNMDQTKALYKNKTVQLVEGNIYRGETVKDECNDRCDIYAFFPDTPVGIWLSDVRADYTVEEVMEQIKRIGMDTLENCLSHIKNRITAQNHFRFTEIEFIKHIAPELEDQMWESRKAFAENRRRKDMERAAQREAEEKAYVDRENAEAEQTVNNAMEFLRNGGALENKEVTFYQSRYDYSTYSIVNYLMRKYGVKVPLRTQGWINDKLVTVIIEDGKCEKVRYYKAKGAQCSQKFFDCMNELLAAVKMAAA